MYNPDNPKEIPTIEELTKQLIELDNAPKVNLIELALKAQELSRRNPIDSMAQQIARDKEDEPFRRDW